MARQRRSAKEIERLLEQYHASGVTQRVYCLRAGVGLSTLSRYLQRQRQRGSRLIPVSLAMAGAEVDRGFVE